MTRIIDTTAVINSIRLALQALKPTAPAAGYNSLYVKAGGLYLENSAGTESGPMLPNPMTTAGDVIVGGTSGVPARLAKGNDGEVLKLASGTPTWAADTGFANPMTTAGDIILGGASGAPGRLAIGTSGYMLSSNGTTAAWALPIASPYILIREEQTAGTDGGSFTTGAWRTRTLNAEVVDTGSFATLGSNQITLAAGTYQVNISAPGAYCGSHQAILYNVTDAADALIGTTEYAHTATGYGQTRSHIIGRVTIASPKTFEVRHQCSITSATFGFGDGAGFNTEIFTVCEFWKVA